MYRFARYESHMLSVFRIVVGLLFMQHGAQKLFGMLGGNQVDSYFSMMGLAGFLELFGGLFIAIGLFTRPVPFVLSGMMAVAYFMVHAPQSFWPVVNKGEPAILFCFSFLLLCFTGPGIWSIDRLLMDRERDVIVTDRPAMTEQTPVHTHREAILRR